MTAQEFKAKRQEIWKSQYHAAEALGITRGAVGHYETGRSPVPEIVAKLLECLEQSHVAQKSA